MYQKIIIAGGFRAIEAPAVSAVTPGQLIEQAATGLQPHSTADGFAESIIATEDALQGRTIVDQYAIGDPVQGAVVQPGAVALALCLKGVNYPVGTKLSSNGTGSLHTAPGTQKQTIAVVVVATDLTAAGTDGLVQVRFL